MTTEGHDERMGRLVTAEEFAAARDERLVRVTVLPGSPATRAALARAQEAAAEMLPLSPGTLAALAAMHQTAAAQFRALSRVVGAEPWPGAAAFAAVRRAFGGEDESGEEQAR